MSDVAALARTQAFTEALNAIDAIGAAMEKRPPETNDAIHVFNGIVQGLMKAQKAILGLKDAPAAPLSEPPAAKAGINPYLYDGLLEQLYFRADNLREHPAGHADNDTWRDVASYMVAAAKAIETLKERLFSEPPAALAEIEGLVKETRTLLSENRGRAIPALLSVADRLATALEALSARVGELDAALTEIACGYYADRDAPWRLDRVVNIARAVRNRLPWEPIAELKVTEEEKARGEGLVSRAEAAEARVAQLEAALREARVSDFQLAQLRHAYKQLKAGTVKHQELFADGLIAPVIAKLERTALSDAPAAKGGE